MYIYPDKQSLENLLSLSPYFGKVFCKENLEGLIILTNTSEYEVSLKKLDVSLTIDDKPETRTKRQKKQMLMAIIQIYLSISTDANEQSNVFPKINISAMAIV